MKRTTVNFDDKTLKILSEKKKEAEEEGENWTASNYIRKLIKLDA